MPTKGSVAARFYLGAEFDYLPLRIPYVGLVGPGLGWGYTSFSNNAIFTDGPNKGMCSAETTSLTAQRAMTIGMTGMKVRVQVVNIQHKLRWTKKVHSRCCCRPARAMPNR